VEEYE
jgi:hypothetical protein